MTNAPDLDAMRARAREAYVITKAATDDENDGVILKGILLNHAAQFIPLLSADVLALADEVARLKARYEPDGPIFNLERFNKNLDELNKQFPGAQEQAQKAWREEQDDN